MNLVTISAKDSKDQVSKLIAAALNHLLPPVINEVANLWSQNPKSTLDDDVREMLSHCLVKHIKEVVKPQCTAYTRKGLRCKRRSFTGLCGTHHPKPHKDRVVCSGMTKRSERCKRSFISKNGISTCYQHRSQSPLDEILYYQSCEEFERIKRDIRSIKEELQPILRIETYGRGCYLLQDLCKTKVSDLMSIKETYTRKKFDKLIKKINEGWREVYERRDRFLDQYSNLFTEKVEKELKPKGARLQEIYDSVPARQGAKKAEIKKVVDLYKLIVGWAESCLRRDIPRRIDPLIEYIQDVEEEFEFFLANAKISEET